MLCCRAASFYAAPGKQYDAALAAPAPALILLYSKSKAFKGIKVHIKTFLFCLILCNKN
jgi:hypothetical protein